jgi:cystathionine beta-lyase/cystathionine gamma-synthase
MDLTYILNELGEERENYFRAVSPPIMQSSNFCFDSVSDLRNSLAYEMDIPFYTRGHNPTVAILQKKIAALEGAEASLVFSSGSAAASACILSCVKAGDHIVSVQKPYSWTTKLLNNFLARFGVTTTFIDGTDTENFRKAIQPNTTLFIMESPNSMTFEMQDISEVVKIAKEHNITTVVDNSYASPLNQQPIALGADMVFHSATKYLNGHSDIVAGVLCGSRERMEKVFQGEYMTLGAAISPHDAWLMIRGLRTLAIRMERVAQTTPKIVEFLAQHPSVEKVIYPAHPSFPQYELAQKYLKNPTGQFSILLKATDIEAVERFCDNLKRFLLACSWGGYESLVYPVCVLYNSMNYGSTTLPWNLVRFYVGLEEEEVLRKDLENALEMMNK